MPYNRSCLGRDLAQNRAELVKIDRFREVEIESRLPAALDIFSRGEAADRYGFHRSFSFGFGDQVIAVAIGQGDVAQEHVELP